MALGRLPIRLVVFRSVALSQPPSRLHPPCDSAVARDRCRGDLCLRGSSCFPSAAFACLRIVESAVSGRAGVAQSANLALAASGSASDVSRRRDRGAVRSAGLCALPGRLDRNALGHGSGESVLRTRGVRACGHGTALRRSARRVQRWDAVGRELAEKPTFRTGVLSVR